MRKKILITPRPFFEKGMKEVEELYNKNYEVIVNNTGRRYLKEELIQLIEEADAIITGNDLLNQEVLSKAKHLKVISKFGVGLDNIDIKYAEKNNIKVFKALNANSVSVAEMAMMMILTSLRKYCRLVENSKKGLEKRIMGIEAKEKVIGILGLGAIGKNVAKYANAFGMKVIAYDPYVLKQNVPDYISMDIFDKVLKNSDIISLHMPLLDTTKNLINAEAISKMKDGAIIINTARAGLIDERDLYDALVNGKLAYVSEDVELAERSKQLVELRNYDITPHAASFTNEADRNMMRISVKNIIDGLEE